MQKDTLTQAPKAAVHLSCGEIPPPASTRPPPPDQGQVQSPREDLTGPEGLLFREGLVRQGIIEFPNGTPGYYINPE